MVITDTLLIIWEAAAALPGYPKAVSCNKKDNFIEKKEIQNGIFNF